jgi:hypothetical protein
MLRVIISWCLLVLVSNSRGEDLPRALSKLEGLANVYQVSTNVFSGSQPEGEAGFVALQQLGITTILSVDGTIPDVELAKRHGMRYIHLPIGYDGISADRARELAQVAATIKGPLYVHCHHGKHRGPTAAAFVCLAEGVWTSSIALEWLHLAGTSTNYAGLYRAVREYQPPDAILLVVSTNDLPEVMRPSSLVAAMVAIDGHQESLKACQQTGWSSPEAQPDVVPIHEALLLWEQFKELGRLEPVVEDPSDFHRRLATTTKATEALFEGLQAASDPSEWVHLDKLFNQVNQSCVGCHQVHRD